MSFDYADGIALLQLIVFIPCLAIAILLCTRHGFGRASGWWFAIIFTLLRITGAILHYVAHSSNDGTVKSAITGELVCDSIGVSPLNLILLGMLSRVNDHTTRPLPPMLFRGVALCSLVGIALGIVGGFETSYSTTGFAHISGETKAAIIIFFVVFVAQLSIMCFLAMKSSQTEAGERRLVLAAAIASPFLLVRFVYGFEYVFRGNRRFSPVYGDMTLYLCVNVLEEIAVLLIALATGLTLRRLAMHSRDMPLDGPTNPGTKFEGMANTGETSGAVAGTGAGAGIFANRTRQPRRKPHMPIALLIYYIREWNDRRKQQS